MFKTKWDYEIRETCADGEVYSYWYLDPFADDLDHAKLFNIASGCPTSDEVAKCFLGIIDRGKLLYEEFNSRITKGKFCEKNYWDPIKMQVWKDFSFTNKTSQVLGFLLTKSQELKSPIDIDEALKYPLSPVPLAIAHADGEIRKTNIRYDHRFFTNTNISHQHRWKVSVRVRSGSVIVEYNKGSWYSEFI